MPLWDRPPIDAISASNNLFSSGTFRMLGGSGVTVRSDASGALLDANETLGAWRNFEQNDALPLTAISQFSKTPFYFGEQIPGNITMKSFGIKLSNVTSTEFSMSVHLGIYTRVNSTSMNLVGSGSDAFRVSSASSASFSGNRNLVLTSPGTVAAISTLSGGDYVFGMMFSVTAAALGAHSLYGAGGSLALSSSAAIGQLQPGTNAFSTGTSQGFIPLQGRGSVTVNVMPANVVASDLMNQASGSSAMMRPWIFMRS